VTGTPSRNAPRASLSSATSGITTGAALNAIRTAAMGLPCASDTCPSINEPTMIHLDSRASQDTNPETLLLFLVVAHAFQATRLL
jgi:fatty acid/phospholipid biosynthesis enzyme